MQDVALVVFSLVFLVCSYIDKFSNVAKAWLFGIVMTVSIVFQGIQLLQYYKNNLLNYQRTDSSQFGLFLGKQKIGLKSAKQNS